jgi:O6-methylguanine-DNA--protein-cysteine methyltransferase
MESIRVTTPNEPREVFLERLPTPIGNLLIVSDEAALLAVDFGDRERRLRDAFAPARGRGSLREGPGPLGILDRLERYFAGELAAIDDIPVATTGTPFETAVWQALRGIPAGTVTTYGALAVTLGHPVSASRAVGLANG